MRETELEGEVGRYFLSVGFFCRIIPKIITKGRRKMGGALRKPGQPDMYIIYHGRFFGVEIKLPDGRQSDEQKEYERELRSIGKGHYFIVRSLQDAFNVKLAITTLTP